MNFIVLLIVHNYHQLSGRETQVKTNRAQKKDLMVNAIKLLKSAKLKYQIAYWSINIYAEAGCENDGEFPLAILGRLERRRRHHCWC